MATMTEPRTYTDADRVTALATLAANGDNVKKTARETSIPEATLRLWREKVLGKPAPPVPLAVRAVTPPDEGGLTIQEQIKREIGYIGFGNLSDVVQWDAAGQVTLTPSAELTPPQAALISEITVKRRRTVEGDELWEIEETRIKTRDKLGALNSLAKIEGLMPTGTNVVVNNDNREQVLDLSGVPTEELERRIAAARAITGG